MQQYSFNCFGNLQIEWQPKIVDFFVLLTTEYLLLEERRVKGKT